jgi:hypothetical protein
VRPRPRRARRRRSRIADKSRAPPSSPRGGWPRVAEARFALGGMDVKVDPRRVNGCEERGEGMPPVREVALRPYSIAWTREYSDIRLPLTKTSTSLLSCLTRSGEPRTRMNEKPSSDPAISWTKVSAPSGASTARTRSRKLAAGEGLTALSHRPRDETQRRARRGPCR